MVYQPEALPSEVLGTREVLRDPAPVYILDGGAQYVDMIHKATERLGYRSVVVPIDTPLEQMADAGAFIISGGPSSTHADDAPMPDESFWETEVPTLGICYGHQAIATAFGGVVETGEFREEGRKKTTVDVKHPLFARVKPDIEALFTHGDFVTQLPEGFDIIGEHTFGDEQVISAMARGNFMSVQFHPEVFDDTPLGYEVFRAFLGDIALLPADENMLGDQTEALVAELSAEIAEKAGDRHVIAFASGGIDSTVATLLAQGVIDPAKLHIYYFDNGFMRDEDDEVIAMLAEAGLNVEKIDATESFEQATIEIDGVTYGPLIDVLDPKIKRKIIGNHFAELKDRIAAGLGLDTTEVMLLQGTNAADRIESGNSLGGGQATEQIKEHHNQVQAIKDLEAAGLLIEPLNRLYKDEIRRIGEYMGLPEEIAWRHPFPGPGNAIRIICGTAETYEPVDIQLARRIDDYVGQFGQALASRLLPTKSVGVGGDQRSYVMPVALQGEADWGVLEQLARGDRVNIPEMFKGHVNRVIYTLGAAPIDELTLTETTLGRQERALLRQVDSLVFEHIREHGMMRAISQMPVVLIPFGVGHTRSIVLRPFVTSTYMTGRALTPGHDVDPEFLLSLSDKILTTVPDVSQVFVELTDKPPATTEWE